MREVLMKESDTINQSLLHYRGFAWINFQVFLENVDTHNKNLSLPIQLLTYLLKYFYRKVSSVKSKRSGQLQTYFMTSLSVRDSDFVQS